MASAPARAAKSAHDLHGFLVCRRAVRPVVEQEISQVRQRGPRAGEAAAQTRHPHGAQSLAGTGRPQILVEQPGIQTPPRAQLLEAAGILQAPADFQFGQAPVALRVRQQHPFEEGVPEEVAIDRPIRVAAIGARSQIADVDQTGVLAVQGLRDNAAKLHRLRRDHGQIEHPVVVTEHFLEFLGPQVARTLANAVQDGVATDDNGDPVRIEVRPGQRPHLAGRRVVQRLGAEEAVETTDPLVVVLASQQPPCQAAGDEGQDRPRQHGHRAQVPRRQTRCRSLGHGSQSSQGLGHPPGLTRRVEKEQPADHGVAQRQQPRHLRMAVEAAPRACPTGPSTLR